MKTNIIYFSPTETTKKIVRQIAGFITTEIAEFDITTGFKEKKPITFDKNDLVIIGIPVYSGRVPASAKDLISQMKGDGTAAALIVGYGNRNYDDSLLELKEIVQSNGFLAVAAAAFVTEHSVVPQFGAGRPNEEDLSVIRKFAEQLKQKVNSWSMRISYRFVCQRQS